MAATEIALIRPCLRLGQRAGMTPDDLAKMRVCRIAWKERNLLRTALEQWSGPVSPTDQLAVALGFRDVDDLFKGSMRLARLLGWGIRLSPPNATRALAAAEVVFVSDVFGAGVEWETLTGRSDVETLATIRGIQRKLVGGYDALCDR